MVRRSLLPRRAWLVVFLVVLYACAARPLEQSGTTGNQEARVAKVTDGDTIRVLYRGREERVRLIGVDTPEVPWYGGPDECFGVEAANYAKRRLEGQVVRLVSGVERRDRYGRLLAYVYLDEELFNLTLVRLGFATADPFPPNTRLAALFAQAQGRARAAGKGLWSRCPLP
ncbi:MAG: thermonuclease family protein [Actinomycetota bacterium]|nr:thermonuclease family protein [Actinomycetota bacterium]